MIMSGRPVPGGPSARGAGEIRSSFDEFYLYWLPRLTGYLESQTSDHRWVEDIAQESMLTMAAKWDYLMTYDKPSAWLFKTATTMLRRWQSRAREQCTSIDDMITRGAHAGLVAPRFESRTAAHLDLMNAIRTLPRRQREALALHCLFGFPLADVGRIMGITEGSAKTHVHRARKRLEDLLRSPRPAADGEMRA
ncbi:RNA polymerase sigma factor [Actinomadura alba]|uniref:RNA polymerase sigma factor n=2 Tax=Actinomadura alba TaxID=406431 RepID=A0ABR7LP69_9ACTN|nr:RNA polymerase sigma factor [Actinomadura alba]